MQESRLLGSGYGWVRELLGSNFNVESLDVVSAKAELQSDRNGLKKNAGVVFGKFVHVR